MDSLGERIACLRKEKGLSQRKLMEVLNFENLSKYEKNQRQPNYEILNCIADFFHVSTDWLLTGKEKEEEKQEDKVHSILGELTDREVRFIELFRQLDDVELTKIEGMLEMKIYESKSVKRGRSSTYQSGEEAATKEKKHA